MLANEIEIAFDNFPPSFLFGIQFLCFLGNFFILKRQYDLQAESSSHTYACGFVRHTILFSRPLHQYTTHEMTVLNKNARVIVLFLGLTSSLLAFHLCAELFKLQNLAHESRFRGAISVRPILKEITGVQDIFVAAKRQTTT